MPAKRRVSGAKRKGAELLPKTGAKLLPKTVVRCKNSDVCWRALVPSAEAVYDGECQRCYRRKNALCHECGKKGCGEAHSVEDGLDRWWCPEHASHGGVHLPPLSLEFAVNWRCGCCGDKFPEQERTLKRFLPLCDNCDKLHFNRLNKFWSEDEVKKAAAASEKSASAPASASGNADTQENENASADSAAAPPPSKKQKATRTKAEKGCATKTISIGTERIVVPFDYIPGTVVNVSEEELKQKRFRCGGIVSSEAGELEFEGRPNDMVLGQWGTVRLRWKGGVLKVVYNHGFSARGLPKLNVDGVIHDLDKL